MKHLKVLEPKENSLMKLVTFVPIAQADIVRNALLLPVAVILVTMIHVVTIWKEGTFRAKEGTHPFCGVIGELHREGEVRIETILPAFKKSEVVRALLSVHPYEEPAFDLYPLQNEWAQAGSGNRWRTGRAGNGDGILETYKENV